MTTHISSSNDATPDFSLLLPSAQSGDKDAQLTIVQAFRPLVLKLALQEFDPVQRVELIDVLTVQVLEAIHKFPGEHPERFPGFVKKHLLLSLSYYKRKQIRKKLLAEKLNTLERTNPVYLEDFGRTERHRKLKEAYESLPPEDRRLVYLAAIDEDSSWNDIKDQFQQPISTLYGRYKRALRAMKDVLSEKPDRAKDSS